MNWAGEQGPWIVGGRDFVRLSVVTCRKCEETSAYGLALRLKRVDLEVWSGPFALRSVEIVASWERFVKELVATEELKCTHLKEM